MTQSRQSMETVQRLGLTVYSSRFSGTKCSFCRHEVSRGDPIARLTPDLLGLTYRLGMSTKVFKYVHLSCLPTLMGSEHIGNIVLVAQRMLGQTDPEWPRDGVGFSSADASPVAKWLQEGAPAIAAQAIAKRLRKYASTQLSSQEGEAVMAAFASCVDDMPTRGRSNGESALDNPGSRSNMSSSDAAPVMTGPVVERAGHRTMRRPGEIRVRARDGTLLIELDPPWKNDAHAKIKDLLKRSDVGARFDRPTEAWSVSPSAFVKQMDRLLDGQYVLLTSAARKAVQGVLDRDALSAANSLEASGLAKSAASHIGSKVRAALPDGLALYPFQEAGVAFLEAAGGCALVGDQMGLGKTVQALAWLAMHGELRPAMVVVPSIVATNWEREARRWLPDDAEHVYRVRGGKDAVPAGTTVTVISYDLLWRRPKDFHGVSSPKVVIADECQYVKNFKTKRTQAVLDLLERSKARFIALSGTPVLNRPSEFFTALKALRPSRFRWWKAYTERYCGGHQTRFGYECGGATNTDELASELRDLMVRRLKSQVLKELPPKTRTDIWIDMDSKERALYRRAVTASYAGSGDHLAAITAARKAVGSIKARHAVQWVQEYRDQGVPLVLFAHHRHVLDEIEEGCGAIGINVSRIDGTTPQERRGSIVDRFQDGRVDVVLISIQAGSTGITLTRASDVLMVERSWTPAVEEQAEDRTHRIGQERAVQVRYLMLRKTIDDDMDRLLNDKRAVLASIFDGGAPMTDESLDIRRELIDTWRRRKARTGKRRLAGPMTEVTSEGI